MLLQLKRMKILKSVIPVVVLSSLSVPVEGVPVVPNFQSGSLTSHTETSSTVTETINVIEYQTGGFLGCNLHYVRLTQRDELAISLLNNSAQGAVAVPPITLHKYLYTGVRGTPYRIPNSEWSDVAQLPTEKFVDMRGIPVPRDRIYNKN